MSRDFNKAFDSMFNVIIKEAAKFGELTAAKLTKQSLWSEKAPWIKLT